MLKRNIKFTRNENFDRKPFSRNLCMQNANIKL